METSDLDQREATDSRAPADQSGIYFNNAPYIADSIVLKPSSTTQTTTGHRA